MYFRAQSSGTSYLHVLVKLWWLMTWAKLPGKWPERIRLTLTSVVLLAVCFCTLYTMAFLRVPGLWLSFTNIRFYIFYTCLSRNHSQMLCKTYFITLIGFLFFLRVPMLALIHFLIILSNFSCKSSSNQELPLCNYYIVSKMRTHSMHLGIRTVVLCCAPCLNF